MSSRSVSDSGSVSISAYIAISTNPSPGHLQGAVLHVRSAGEVGGQEPQGPMGRPGLRLERGQDPEEQLDVGHLVVGLTGQELRGVGVGPGPATSPPARQ